MLAFATPAQAQLGVSAVLEPPGAQEEGQFGHAVADAGDIDGDGISDLLIGAPQEDVNATDAGRAYVLSGADGSELLTLTSDNEQSEGEFGYSVDGVGDINGDGVPDFVVGAHRENVNTEDQGSDSGRAYLISGADGSILHTLVSPNFDQAGHFGYAVAGVGDTDGDDVPDVLVGAENEDYGTDYDDIEVGRAYLFSGADGSLLHTLETPNPTRHGNFGNEVAAIPDVDGDDTPDLVVGAHAEEVDGSDRAGRVYLFSGADGTEIQTIDPPFPGTSDYFGAGVAAIEDFDGDDTPDLVVVAESEASLDNQYAGRVYIVSGADGSWIGGGWRPDGDGSFNGSVTNAGDLDGDGTEEIVVGASGEEVAGESNAGRIYLFSVDGATSATFSSPNAVSPGHFGSHLAALDDVDGTGTPGVAIGARREHIGSTDEAGRAYIMEPPLVAYTADVDGDGTVDFESAGVEIDFSGVSGSGEVSVEKYDGEPPDLAGIDKAHVSQYRFVIEADGNLTFDSDTEVRLDAALLDGVADPSNVTIYKRPTAGAGVFTELPTTYEADTDELVVTTDSFSEFVLASDSESLPVELVAFDAAADGEVVRLTWQTASETGNAGFDVQRNLEGRWKTLGFVEGAGTTEQPQVYRFADDDLPFDAERVTYRLRQVDRDGTVHYTDEVELNREAPQRLTLHGNYPNPFRAQTTLRYALPQAGSVRLGVYDARGRRVAVLVDEWQSVGRKEIAFEARNLTSGVYFVRLSAGNQTRIQRLTVVR